MLAIRVQVWLIQDFLERKMINGDNINGVWERVAYFAQSLIKTSKGSTKNTNVLELNLEVVDDYVLSSPTRNLSNMFWETVDWNRLSAVLGGNVNVFDVACGKGRYGFLYERLLGKSFSSYTGIDIHRYELFPDRYQQIEDSAENSYLYLENHNLIVSQSGLEHIEHDLLALDKITKVLCDSGKPFVQIHLVPATMSLFLYLWHGWRQYSKKNLGEISRYLTASYSVNVTLIPLGGWHSFIAHLRHITLPFYCYRFLKRNYRDFNIEGTTASTKIKSAVLSERKVGDKLPTFWAVVIHRSDIKCESLFKKGG